MQKSWSTRILDMLQSNSLLIVDKNPDLSCNIVENIDDNK